MYRRWSEEDLENISTFDFIIAILNERQYELNPLSLLSKKIDDAKCEIRKLKREKLK